MVNGKIIKNYNGYYYVDLGSTELLECRLRGRMKGADRILVGDNVHVTLLNAEQGVIEDILPRKNQIHRPGLANIDQMFVIMAAKSPDPNHMLLDKLLMTCESSGIHPAICINKCDLDRETAVAYHDFYQACDYVVLLVSAATGEGVDALVTMLQGKTNAFAGPSGVGKSSLLSRILKRDDLSIGAVSKKIQRGRHTTRHSEIMRYDADTYVVDTPGFSFLDFCHMEPRELIKLFPDLYPYSGNCRFSSCLHRSEPDCGVKQAIEGNPVRMARYETYCTILNSILERKK